ncbi:MAG: 50S ribosomal protein L23 [Candidatus Omnitrophica bacterium]|nr:50S ribosomal protein L23 [Candidatus Omnitrophota bacterium]
MAGINSSFSVIRSPLVSEKGTSLANLRKYVFWVDKRANKIDIKKAVEKVYNVKIDNVNSMTVKGKTKRVRWNKPGKTSSWKKAIVTLKEGFEIKIT